MNKVIIENVDYVAPAIMEETVSIDKAVIVTLCKD